MAIPMICTRNDCPNKPGSTGKYCALCGRRSRITSLTAIVDRATPESGFVDMAVLTGDPESFESSRLLRGLGSPLESVMVPTGWVLRADLRQLKDGESNEYEVTTCDGDRLDIWNPAPKRSQVIQVFRRMPKVELIATPGVALFNDTCREYSINIENVGNSTAELGRPQVPYGFQLADPQQNSPFRIPPGSSVSISIKALFNAVSSRLRLTTEAGLEVLSVELFVAQATIPQMPPGYVVSIDFGTSNTSIYCMSTSTGLVEPVVNSPSDPARYETVLYAPEDKPEYEWQAIETSGVSEASLVRNLKSLLRLQVENPDLQFRRLVFYLGKLLTTKIEPFIEVKNPDDAQRIEFVFTLPVLDGDGGEKHEAYKGILIRAAEKTGFLNDSRRWSLSTILEPDGGSLDVLSEMHEVHQFRDGDQILVVDIGGGTTDVTTGKFQLVGSRPRLYDIYNYSPKIDNNAFASGSEIGGEFFLWNLGWMWIGSGRGAEVTNDVALQKQNLTDKQKILNEYWCKEENAPSMDFNFGAKNSWERLYPDFRFELEKCKKLLNDDTNRLKDRLYEMPPATIPSRSVDGYQWLVTLELVDRAVSSTARGCLVNQTLQFLDRQGLSHSDVSHVVLIGGSAKLFHVRAEFEKTFPRKLLPLGDYVPIAVCRGATRIYQSPPPTLPLTLSVELSTFTFLLAKRGDIIQRPIKFSQQLTLGLDKLAVRITCQLSNGSHHPFITLSAPPNFNGFVEASVTGEQVSLILRPLEGQAHIRTVRL